MYCGPAESMGSSGAVLVQEHIKSALVPCCLSHISGQLPGGGGHLKSPVHFERGSKRGRGLSPVVESTSVRLDLSRSSFSSPQLLTFSPRVSRLSFCIVLSRRLLSSRQKTFSSPPTSLRAVPRRSGGAFSQSHLPPFTGEGRPYS